jgi:hypothetical protein
MKDNKSDPKKDEKNPVSSTENKDNKDQNSNNINSDPAKNEENKEENKEEENLKKEQEENQEQNKEQTFNEKDENIYNEEKIKELMDSTKEKRKEIISQLYSDNLKKNNIKMKSNQLKAIYNFHFQNIEFIFNKFNTYSIDIITKLANIFSFLLDLKEDIYNLQLTNIEGAREDIYKPIPEPDFCYIINKKLLEIKHNFIKFKLFPDPKQTRNKNESHFYLTNKELNIIFSYLNESYFPFIRLFYHVINLNRVETKKINSSGSKTLAIANNNDMDSAPEKFIIEEPIKRPVYYDQEKMIDVKIEEEIENKFDNNEIKNRQIERENKARNDYLNEVRKLITEKVEELKKDVDAKISENGFEIEKNIQNIKEQYSPAAKKK